ncbi:MAG: hypothetical protein KIT80_03005 [Chitinophagaceae bacterium]|nr:hypothetical protein [Chitinophagaceae bacterium]MCW5925854.1 hypothetical protein [Chitinophagaceae bacterium]
MYRILLVLVFGISLCIHSSGQDKCCSSFRGDNLNYQPTEEDAMLMRASFNKLYASENYVEKRKNPLRDSFWISKSFLMEMVDLLNRNQHVCGYRFSYYLYEPWIGSDKISLAITPTIRDSTYEEHVGRVFNKPEKKCVKVKYNVNKKRYRKRGIKFHRRFEKYYADETTCKDSAVCLSKSVWFDRCLINKIATHMDSTGSDGLTIFSAAYPGWQPELQDSQDAQYQSTFILVATKDRGKKSMWQKSDPILVQHDRLITDNMRIHSEQAKSGASGPVYNHGELCPQKCPDNTSNNR